MRLGLILPTESNTILDDLQLMFLRLLFGTPRTCPTPALLWDSGATLMEHRIAQKKLMFYHHLLNLPKDSLAFEVAQIQEILGYPGLVQESKSLIEKYGLPQPQVYSKGQWRSLTTKAITKQNKQDILEKMKSYKKLEHSKHAKEAFGSKDYIRKLNIPDARLKFSLRAKMTRTVQMNFKGENSTKTMGGNVIAVAN